jgi:hypothetical protein
LSAWFLFSGDLNTNVDFSNLIFFFYKYKINIENSKNSARLEINFIKVCPEIALKKFFFWKNVVLYEIVKSKRSTIEVNVILSGIFLNPLNQVFRMEKIKWNANQFHANLGWFRCSFFLSGRRIGIDRVMPEWPLAEKSGL